MNIEFIIGFISGGALFTGIIWVRLQSQIVKYKSEAELLQLQKAQSDQLTQSFSQTLSEKLSDKFEVLASQLFEEKSLKLNEQSQSGLKSILEPLKERIKDFEKKVDESYSSERADRGNLKGELSKLLELNLKISQEAGQLTRALKGDVKTQGYWGEMILENILERSGLRKGEEYIVQGLDLSLKNEDGQTIKPDVIINLPEGKHIIVDSKVSLSAFDGYIQTEDALSKEGFGKQHVQSLKTHIDSLSAKKYYSSEQLITPDFVILFMPLEPAFALAFKLKPDLLQYAWERQIALVSPTTLLTTLRTVATLWKHERQEQNAMEIAKRGGALYEKFATLVEDLETVGKKIHEASDVHSKAFAKLSTGQGNLIRQVEMLKELGAKTEKKLKTTYEKDQPGLIG